ncbi:MAG: site-2 protease family protein [Pseudomonadota bacterium]
MNLSALLQDIFFVLPIALIAFVCLLTIIVFVHEFGHFSMARALGVRVDTFSIGFGKPLARWVDKKGTEWRIAMLPFGGYVKFFGDGSAASNPGAEVEEERGGPATTQFPKPGNEEEVGQGMTAEEKAVCFHFKPLWARAMIVAAGPISNFILAIAIFWGLLVALGTYVTEPLVGRVVENSAAEEAGFEAGDRMLSVNGKELRDFRDLQILVRLNAGEKLTFEVDRGGETVEIIATPRRTVIEDAYGNEAEAGQLGIGPPNNAVTFVRLGPLEALQKASGTVVDVIGATLKFIGRLIAGKESAEQLGGPVKMAQYASQTAMSGFAETGDDVDVSLLDRLRVSLVNFINLAGLVSVSIGFLNLLPIPVLDGGHLVYYAVEGIAGKPLGARAQAIGFRVGIVLLASFMIFVTWNDVSNLLSKYS